MNDKQLKKLDELINNIDFITGKAEQVEGALTVSIDSIANYTDNGSEPIPIISILSMALDANVKFTDDLAKYISELMKLKSELIN